jgi:uncharacterized membrane protein YkoI
LHPPRARSVVAVALLGLAGLAARAGEADHERARAAVRAGEVLPLPTLLERLQGSYPGQVLELELERDDGRWIYEIKLLQPGGQVLKLEVDARTAAVLKQRRKGAPPPEGTAR